MAAKKNPNAAARPARTGELVEQRARDFIQAQNDSRLYKGKYGQACERFKERHGIPHLSTDDPQFRRSTRKAYEAFQKARVAERNALRRLETAVRNCPASALNEPAKARKATQPKGTLADNIALIESCCRMLNLTPSERLALLSKMASRDFLSCATVAAARAAQGGAS